VDTAGEWELLGLFSQSCKVLKCDCVQCPVGVQISLRLDYTKLWQRFLCFEISPGYFYQKIVNFYYFYIFFGSSQRVDHIL